MYTRQSSEALDHTPVGFSTPRHKARPLDASSLRLSICPPDSGSCLPSPSRATIALNTPTTVSFLALPLTLSPARKRDKCLLSVKATTPTLHRTSYCEKMLQLNLARDEYAQRAAPKSAFGPSYSPAHSECSSSSKSAHSRSPSPPVRRMPQFNNVSHTRTISLTHHTLPRSRTHPSDLSSAAGASVSRRPSRSGNEEVLRSRLEGVLSSASSTRDISCPPSPQRRRAATTGESSYGLITPPHGTLPVPPMTRSRTSPAMTRPSPLTPPPSPPFDANRVALQLRDREGYVSFAEVDGLGMPSDDQDTCDAERGRGRWWLMWKG